MHDKDREPRAEIVQAAPAPAGRAPGKQTRTAALLGPTPRKPAANDQDFDLPRPLPRRRVRHGGPADASALQLGSFGFADEPLFVADEPGQLAADEPDVAEPAREAADHVSGARRGSFGG